MQFCDSCENMMHLKIIKDEVGINQMSYHCIYCDLSKSANTFDGCVSVTNYLEDSSEKNYEPLFNEYIVNDPTLPSVDNIPCPNQDCPTNDTKKQRHSKSDSKVKNNVIYVRYDHKNMKFCYICKNCDTRWITPEYQRTQIITKG